MNKITYFVTWGVSLMMFLSGCTSQGMSLTLAAEHHVQGTQFYDVQMTASVQTGRFQSTQDYYTTQVAFVATQSQFLKATLITRGTPAEVLAAYQQELEAGLAALPTRTPRATPTFAPLIPPTPLLVVPASDPSIPANGGITPNPEAAFTVAPPTSGPRLTNLTASSVVGDDDCAQNATNTFSTSTPEIYIVANAYEITPGMMLASQWDISGQQRTYEFVPDFDINGACIWFYMDQSEFAFQPGSASVSLSVNGTAMGTVTLTLQ